MKQYFAGIKLVLLMGWLGGSVTSCKKMDEYKKYGDGGEIVYPATVDSLKVLPGNGRVMITGLLAGDPNVSKYRIFWNNGSDSLEKTFARHGKIDTLRQIVDGLPEGPMTFTLRTYDDRGNRSIPMTVTGNVYGASFQASVNERGNRAVLNTKFERDGSAVLTWADVDAYVGVLGMRVHYLDANNKERDTVIVAKGKDQVSVIPNAGVTQPISYKTLYLPEAVGVDTFTVTSKALSLFTEVTLLNNVKPIANSANDGNRWANLRDWISNDAVRNHNGFGGTDKSDDAKIYFEAGWGAPGISNGKIYQVVTLPPGKYRFNGSVDWYHVSNKNDVWLIAAPGANGLPDVSNLGSAFASQKVQSGWWDVPMEFTVTQQITLSLGLLLDMSDSGEAMRFNNLRLFIVN